MPKYTIPRQIRIEPSLFGIIERIQEKTGFKTSFFVYLAIKEYLENQPKEILDSRVELGVKFYERKSKVFSFRLDETNFKQLLEFSKLNNEDYTYYIYQAIIHFSLKYI